MGNNFFNYPVINTISKPRLIFPIKNQNLGFPIIHSLKSPQKGIGVMCIEFLVKINYLGIFHEPNLVPCFSNDFLTAGCSKYDEIEISQKLQSLGAHIHF